MHFCCSIDDICCKYPCFSSYIELYFEATVQVAENISFQLNLSCFYADLIFFTAYLCVIIISCVRMYAKHKREADS